MYNYVILFSGQYSVFLFAYVCKEARQRRQLVANRRSNPRYLNTLLLDISFDMKVGKTH
jgi:hypothetical protein